MEKTDIRIGLLTDSYFKPAAELLYEAFQLKIENLDLFTHSKEQAVRLIVQYINPAGFLGAFQNDELLGVMGVRYHHVHNLKHTLKPLLKEFGFFGGLWRGIWNTFADVGIKKKDELYITNLAVAEKARGMGVGTLLVEKAFETACENNMPRLSLRVVNSNPRAKALYERLGFKTVKIGKTGFLTRKAGFTGYFRMVADAGSK